MVSLRKFNSISLSQLEDDQSCLCVSSNLNDNMIVGTENGAFLLTAEGKLISTFMMGEKGIFNEVPSAKFCPQNPNVIYLALENIVTGFDSRIDSKNTGTARSRAVNQVSSFEENTEEINQISVFDKYVAACDDNGEIKIYDTSSKRVFRTLRNKHNNICSSVCFRPNFANEIFSGGLDNQVLLWNFSKIRVFSAVNTQDIFGKNQMSSTYTMSPPMVNDIKCLEDGTKLASALGNGSVIVYEVSSGKKLKFFGMLEGHSSLGASCVSFFTHQNQQHIISGGNDCRINMWKFPNDFFIPVEDTTEPPFQHKQVLMPSKVNCVAELSGRQSCSFIACDQSNKLSYFEVVEEGSM